MSKTDAFNDIEYDGLDPRTKGSADRGVSAARKIELSEMDAPLHVLEQLGIEVESSHSEDSATETSRSEVPEVPHRAFNPKGSSEYPTSQELDDGRRIHLFQDVRESMESTFGDFGSVDDDDEDDVVWTVVDLTDGTVTLKVVGQWGKSRDVPFEDFADNYDPITVETAHGEVPRYGY